MAIYAEAEALKRVEQDLKDGVTIQHCEEWLTLVLCVPYERATSLVHGVVSGLAPLKLSTSRHLHTYQIKEKVREVLNRRNSQRQTVTGISRLLKDADTACRVDVMRMLWKEVETRTEEAIVCKIRTWRENER